MATNDAKSRANESVIKESHDALGQCMDIIQATVKSASNGEQLINSSCYIGMGIITANLMLGETDVERRELADIIIGNCINTIETALDSIDKMNQVRPSGIILPN